MKQTKLVITVYDKDGNVVFCQDPATIANVQSCIDLWHEVGNEISLAFREIDVPSNTVNTPNN